MLTKQQKLKNIRRLLKDTLSDLHTKIQSGYFNEKELEYITNWMLTMQGKFQEFKDTRELLKGLKTGKLDYKCINN
jgi:hypothetical protein